MRLALALLLFMCAASAAPEDVVLRWQRENHSPTQLPENFPAAAIAAVEYWAPFCARHGYRMDLEDGARVLLITPADNKARGRQMRLIDRVVQLLEDEFPVPAGRGAAPAAKQTQPGSAPATGGIPEDPEEGDHPWKIHGEDGVEIAATPTTWGADDIPLDHDPVVFVIPRDERAYGALLAHLGTAHGHVEAWSEVARRDQGFVLPWPLTGAYMERPPGVEEWSPNHELVNRLARLLFLRRYGLQPYWAELGIAWHFEVELLDGIYVFPYRNEFVWAVEHDAWPADLQSRFNQRKQGPLRAEEFCGWRRGNYEPTAARLSFGFMDYLARKRDPDLPELFEAFRLLREENGIRKTGEYSWERNRDYQIPVAEQEALLREHLGDDVFEEAAEFFRAGAGKPLAKKKRH